MINPAQLWRRKPTSATSHCETTLERVRAMRQHAAWESSAPQWSIEERADRVAEARAHVRIPALGNEREVGEPKRYLWMVEFARPLFYSITLCIALGLVIFLLIPERTKKVQVIQSSTVFPSVAHTNLTESVAERFARRALGAAGLDGSE